MFKKFNIKQFRDNRPKLSDKLPWSYLAAPGVVVQKDGLMQRSFAFRGPDLESAAGETVNALSFILNECVKNLSTGWAIQFEAQRFITTDYPGTEFKNLAGFLIEKERERDFSTYGKHYQSSYYVTLTWKPESAVIKKSANFFMKSGDGISFDDLQSDVRTFIKKTNDVAALMSQRLIIDVMDDDQTLSYLHSSISLNWHPLLSPPNKMFIDSYLCDSDIDVGTTLKIGDLYTPITTINDFPAETFPSMFDALNRAEVEYRWSTRFICLGKEEALGTIEKYQKKWYGARKSWSQFMGDMATENNSSRINHGALAMEEDVNGAQRDVMADQFGLGFYTSNIMVWDHNHKRSMEKLSMIQGIIRGSGFIAKEETFNSFDAFLSMMPGNVYANVRRKLVSSGNLSHVIPLSAVWVGQSVNTHMAEINSVDVPHVVCSTGFGTPFFLSLNVGDSGHTLICGPTGSGKSTIGKTGISIRCYLGKGIC